MRQTETANRETLLRVVQSVPSKNAEKVRLWLAEIGNQRLEELEQGPSEIEHLRDTYRNKGYDEVVTVDFAVQRCWVCSAATRK